MPRRTLSVMMVLAALLAFAPSAQAGGPLLVANDGSIITWPAGGGGIVLRLDQGGLGSLDNAGAAALVNNILSVWDNVPQSSAVLSISPTRLSQDINQTNYIPILLPDTPLGYNPVVFDADGQILDDLYGAGARTQILGVSFGPLDNGTSIIEGRVLLNGFALGTLVSTLDFEGVIVHELGHLLGLGHSQINSDEPPSQPTMYPIIHPDIRTLKADDIAWISFLYPTGDFNAFWGSISGAVLEQVGPANLGFQGINVIARQIGGARTDAVSCVSGYNGAPGSGAGNYLIPAMAGKSFSVEIENVHSIFTNGSSVGPLDPPVDFPGTAGHEFWNGALESASDDPRKMTPVAVLAANQTANINILLNTNPPPGGFRASGEFVYAAAAPVYRSSDTITLDLQVMNTSNFDWGCERCPTYRIRVVPSWRPTSEWLMSRWQDDDGSLLRLGPGDIDRHTFRLLKTPPAVGQFYLDVFLQAPRSPGACEYPVVSQTRVPLQCLEWPDFQIGDGAVLQAGGRVGDLLTVSFRQKNFGPGSVVRPSWTEVRLSQDTTFDFGPRDPWVTSVLVMPTMGPGDFRDYCLQGRVPDSPGGDLLILIKADVLNEVPESIPFGGENNNVFVVPTIFTVFRPELMVASGAQPINPNQAQPGDQVFISFTVTNTGNVQSPPVLTQVWLSPDPASSFGYHWFDVNIPALAAGDTSESLGDPNAPWTIPASIPPATYSVLIFCDPTNVAGDFDRKNNLLDVGNLVVRAPVTPAPNLVVRQGLVSMLSGISGRTPRVNATIANVGTKPAPASKLTLYLSADGRWRPTDPVWVSNVAVPALNPGAVFTYSAQPPFPSWARGPYRVIARCDSANTVAETNENDNTLDLGTLSPATRAANWILYR